MVATPPDTPVTTPEDEPTVAIAGLVLVQEPPAVVFDNVIEEPAQTLLLPVMAAGAAITLTVLNVLPHDVV